MRAYSSGQSGIGEIVGGLDALNTDVPFETLAQRSKRKRLIAHNLLSLDILAAVTQIL